MTEEEHRIRDLHLKLLNSIIAVVGAVGVVLSILIGFHQLKSQAKAQSAAIGNQWRQKFYDERLAVYGKATEAAGKVVVLCESGASDAKISEAIAQFKALYWGPMCVTESSDVEAAMKLFHDGWSAHLPCADLKKLALYLAHVCRNDAHDFNLAFNKPASQYGSNCKILAEMTKLVPSASPNPKIP